MEDEIMHRADKLMRSWYADGRIGCDCGNPFNHAGGCDLMLAQAEAEEIAYRSMHKTAQARDVFDND